MRLSREDLADILGAFENSDFVWIDLQSDGVRLSASKSQPADVNDRPLPQAAAMVTAPRLGFFEAHDASGADSLPRLGSRVGADTVIGFIRVMEDRTAVTAGAEGAILAVLVQDGEFVEYGQRLLAIGDELVQQGPYATSHVGPA